VHYTKLPELVDLEDRSDVEYSKIVTGTISSCSNADRVEHVNNTTKLVVPFGFCSDEFESASPGCNAYDRGADVYEVAQNAINAYRDYYLLNNFKRDRLAFNPDGYLDRIYERYLDPLRTQMQFYALFRADMANDIPDDGTSTNFWQSPDGWGPFTVAVTDGFNLLGEILTAPVPGPYYLETLPDGRDVYQMNDGYAEPPVFTLEVPEARFFSTEWDYDSGYFWYERISHIGNFVDKVAALSQLTDPETSFLGADQASDVRQYSINYYRIFPSQMQHVWGGAMSERWDRYAPVWTPKGAMSVRPISDKAVIPKDGSIPIDPQIGFSVELYAAALGVSLIPATYDQGFLDASRIFLQGNGQQIDSSKPKVTFTDPNSGRIYVAVSFLEGVIENGIGARMLQRANELAKLATDNPKDPSYGVQLKSYVQIVDVMQALTATYANTTIEP